MRVWTGGLPVAMKSDGSENRRRTMPVWPVLLSVLAVNLGSLVAGYAMGYPSSALLDLEQWSPEYAFEKRSVDSGLFAVSLISLLTSRT